MPPVKRPRSITNTHHHHTPNDHQPNNTNNNESKPKLFQCKGFGDCHMVFTRSEHLARHTRKHTGEKPYQCIVPGCTRMFSRWDNMMQHTQTHRTNQPLPTTTPSQQQSQSSQPQRKQKIQQQQQQQQIHPQEQGGLRQRQQQEQQQQQQQQVYQGGLMSPISLGSPEQPHWDDIVEDQVVQEIPSCLRHDHDQQEQEKKEKEIVPKQRRLSVADLCNPIHLTLDEFEALEGFARFRETPLFYESLRDLANIACIEPKPSSLSSSSSSSPSPSSTSSSSSCSLSQYHYA